MGCTYNI